MDEALDRRRRPGAAARRRGAFLTAALAVACWAGGASAASAAPAPDLLSPLTAAACSVPSAADRAVTLAVYGVGRELGVSSTVMLAGFEVGWVESHMNNLNCGDRDSLGVFQQRASQGWGTTSQIRNPRYAARQFFVRAQAEEKACGSCSAGVLAQRVQRSAYPERYPQAASTAASLRSEAASRYQGRSSIGDVCGSGFRYLDGHELSGGTVYLLWDGHSNCVTTIKNAGIGTPSAMKAFIDPAGSAYRADSGPA